MQISWRSTHILLLSAFCLLLMTGTTSAQRWSESKANAWYAQQPWYVGSNFSPASAINQLEMWQAGFFLPPETEKEMGWAEVIGMNTMGVFLHDLPWKQDSQGFQKRIDTFLTIASKHHIKPI